jgi:hypothetical protein
MPIRGSVSATVLPARPLLPIRPCHASECVYVTNAAANGGYVTVYPVSASGNVAPAETISGSDTGIQNPYGIAVDARENIYVCNVYGGGDPGQGSITVFRKGATGNVSPQRTIVGAHTGLQDSVYIALDTSDNLYVANTNANDIEVFAPVPTATSRPSVLSPVRKPVSTFRSASPSTTGPHLRNELGHWRRRGEHHAVCGGRDW